jgi:anti-anti-sigma factor
MQITHHPHIDSVELKLTGRLDATWAEHVSDSIDAAVRTGSHRVVLNFAGVNYISSLGIGVVMKHYQRLKAVNGSLAICEPSAATLRVLTAAGLASYLITDGAAELIVAPAERVLERPEAAYHAYPQPVAQPLTCSAIGAPEKFTGAGFAEDDARPLTFGAGTFGLGLGAFGEGFTDCRERFGEFLAAGGCAITLPTNDQHALPDYIVAEGVLVPKVETLYALAGAGDFPWMVRFDTNRGGRGTLTLSELLDAAFEIAAGETIAFVAVSEAGGLVGATLRKSPALSSASLEFPAIRDWVSFTTERTSERTLALLVGVAARTPPPAAAAFLRRLRNATSPVCAHVHAASFPYRPIQRGELPFGKTINDLLASAAPESVHHLMTDTRPFDGVGETDLVRGACWVGALPGISPG